MRKTGKITGRREIPSFELVDPMQWGRAGRTSGIERDYLIAIDGRGSGVRDVS
jgi:hypothetical protein